MSKEKKFYITQYFTMRRNKHWSPLPAELDPPVEGGGAGYGEEEVQVHQQHQHQRHAEPSHSHPHPLQELHLPRQPCSSTGTR